MYYCISVSLLWKALIGSTSLNEQEDILSCLWSFTNAACN